MSALPNASATNSNDTKLKVESPTIATGKPTETPLSQDVLDWGKKVVETSNRMSTDENYRKEIAKRTK